MTALQLRLKKIVGQLNGVQKMLESDAPCEDILTQINAANGALHRLSLTTVSALFGRKAAVAYVTVIIVGAILCGIAINFIPNALPPSVASASAHHALGIVHWASAAFLAVMMAYNLARPLNMGHKHNGK